MRKSNRQSGFSMVEIMVVIFVVMAVMAVVFTAISSVQKRYRTEEERVDTLQNAREFVDQIERDLHNAGYPSASMYATSTPDYTQITLAWPGLVAASKTEILFEGDLDNSGTVSSIRYQLQAGSGGKCPCTLRRSANYKSSSGGPTGQTAVYSAEVENVVNSLGSTSAWQISGNAPNGTSNDTLYSQYKNDVLFQFLDSTGAAVTVPDDLSTSGNLTSGQTAATTIRTVVVTLNVLGPYTDIDSGRRPIAAMRATVKLPNL